MIGEVYGYLTIIEDLGIENKKRRVKCKCKCGVIKKYFYSAVKSGNTNSCGCYQKEQTIAASTTHGMKHTRLYNIWQGIKQRCYNPNATEYKNYGGRGILVCDEWVGNFNAFYTWAINNGYKENLTIERYNVNGNYEPSNCKWIPLIEQFNNTTRVKMLTYNGETKSISQWARDLNMYSSAISRRLKKGKSIKEALLK